MTDPQQRPGFLIRRLQQSAVAIFLREVSNAGSDLTPVQYAVLATIRSHPGLDQATLAGLVALDRVTLGDVAERLLQKGLIARNINPDDRRARVLAITDAGCKELALAEPAVDAAQEKIVSGLSPNEQARFLELLAKLVEATSEDSRAPIR